MDNTNPPSQPPYPPYQQPTYPTQPPQQQGSYSQYPPQPYPAPATQPVQPYPYSQPLDPTLYHGPNVIPPTSPQKGNRTLWIVLGSVGGVLILCCILSCIAIALSPKSGNSANSNPTNTASSQQAVSNDSTPTSASIYTATVTPKSTATPKPTAAPKPKVVLSVSGSQQQRTSAFNVSGSSQKIAWSCNPSSDYFGNYNMIIDIYTADGTDLGNAVNDMCEQGNTSGAVTVNLNPGSYKLDIFTDTGWYHVTVTDIP